MIDSLRTSSALCVSYPTFRKTSSSVVMLIPYVVIPKVSFLESMSLNNAGNFFTSVIGSCIVIYELTSERRIARSMCFWTVLTIVALDILLYFLTNVMLYPTPNLFFK